tara:strand:- start:325 stop:477 length:153 start_codon:yes stop_codon:yes gene_type:complete
LIKKNKIPEYFKFLIKNNPKITSGRKNYYEHNYRILETIKMIKKYFNLKN